MADFIFYCSKIANLTESLLVNGRFNIIIDINILVSQTFLFPKPPKTTASDTVYSVNNFIHSNATLAKVVTCTLKINIYFYMLQKFVAFKNTSIKGENPSILSS